MASFDTIMGQMTEMFQRKIKPSLRLSKIKRSTA